MFCTCYLYGCRIPFLFNFDWQKPLVLKNLLPFIFIFENEIFPRPDSLSPLLLSND